MKLDFKVRFFGLLEKFGVSSPAESRLQGQASPSCGFFANLGEKLATCFRFLLGWVLNAGAFYYGRYVAASASSSAFMSSPV